MDPTFRVAVRTAAKGKRERVLTELPVHPAAGVFCVGTVAWLGLGLGKTLTPPERPRAPLPLGASRLTRMLQFPLVNSLKASVTCSRVLVFLKSRFTEPSSF